jgi:putative chitinase
MQLKKILFSLISFFAISSIQASESNYTNYAKDTAVELLQSTACTTNINKYTGTCVIPSTCTGGIFNNLCPGSKKCCVEDTTSPPWIYWKYVSKEDFKSIFSSVSNDRTEALYPWFNSALWDVLDDKMGNPSCHIIAAFAAQVGHESGDLMLFEELASGEAYEGRCSKLGNCNPGDGVRFKGRGAIQLTGRFNYQALTNYAKKDFIKNPESVVLPSNGFEASVWFWTSNNLNRYCTGKVNDFFELTRKINGGTNGIDDRLSKWENAKKVLQC